MLFREMVTLDVAVDGPGQVAVYQDNGGAPGALITPTTGGAHEDLPQGATLWLVATSDVDAIFNCLRR